MRRLLYSSVALTPLNEGELDALLGSSRRLNETAGLTGLLVHVRDDDTLEAAFVQVLEGDADAVERTFDRIRADELHTDVVVLADEPIDVRSFGDWTMRLEQVTPARLIALAGGPEQGRGPLTVADAVRDRTAMEHLVGGYARPDLQPT